jgi:hypothetical protein
MNTGVTKGLELAEDEQEGLRCAVFLRQCGLTDGSRAERPREDRDLAAYIEGLGQRASETGIAAQALRSAQCGWIIGEKLDAHVMYFAELLHETEPAVWKAVASEARDRAEAQRAHRQAALHRALLLRVRESVA